MKKLWIMLNTRPGEPEKRVDIPKPKEDVSAIEVPRTKCQCGAEPMLVHGAGKIICPDSKHRHDTYMADAVCVKCDGHVGILYAKMDTLFGLEEDERVMSMAVKVY
jgi:hypothetical protein